MDKAEAKRLVIVGTAGTAALTMVGSFRDGKLPPSSVGAGAAVAGIGLAVVAEFWPAGAGGLALVMLTTSALVFGGPAWAGITTAVTRRDGVPAGTETSPGPAAPVAKTQPRFGVPGE